MHLLLKKWLPFLLVVLSESVFAQQSFQLMASDSPAILGPGIISDGFSNRDMAISPDGNDIFYTLQWSYGIFSVVLHSEKINGQWTLPETAWFSGKYNDLEPAFSPDGSRLFFTSNRPHGKTDRSENDYDIWFVQKKGNKWELPVRLDSTINTDKDEFYPSVAKNGNLYFTRDNGDAKDDIFFSRFTDGHYERPVALSDSVNSKGYDFNAYIDPDEKYILFSSYKRKDDLGGGDLYVSRRENGVWRSAVHLDPGINSTALDYSPFVSPDHKYFFFTSKRRLIQFPFAIQKPVDEIRKILNSFGNGNDDIYIMNFSSIESFVK